jgi:hypothetical protein
MFYFCQFESHRKTEQQLMMVFIHEAYLVLLIEMYLSNMMILIVSPRIIVESVPPQFLCQLIDEQFAGCISFAVGGLFFQ